jgi:photosystem II stability/assembly factor-like uncharacterized protein
MKKTILCLLSAWALATAAWTSIGPSGGPVYSGAQSAGSPQVMYSVPQRSSPTLLRSTDGGATWGLTAGALPYYTVALAASPTDPNRLFATYYSQLYRSTNGGGSWTTTNFPSGNYAQALAVNPLNQQSLVAAGYVYIGSYYYTVAFRSGDGGATWDTTLIADTLAYSMSHSVHFDPVDTAVIYLGDYAYGLSRVFKSTDAGATWTRTGLSVTGNYVYSLHASPLDHDIVLAGTYSGGLWRTTNGGASWTRALNQYFIYTLACAPGDPATIYAGADTCVWRSLDTGRTWNRCGPGLVGREMRTLLPLGESIVVCGTRAGLFRSTDRGQSWQADQSGLCYGIASALELAGTTPPTLYAELTDDAVYKTTDGGVNWSRCPEFLSCGNIVGFGTHPAAPQTVWTLEGSG